MRTMRACQLRADVAAARYGQQKQEQKLEAAFKLPLWLLNNLQDFAARLLSLVTSLTG